MLKYASEKGIDPGDMKGMAALSGRNIRDFKAAAERRTRAVRKLLAQERGVGLDKEPS